jgi:hypothetical protein
MKVLAHSIEARIGFVHIGYTSAWGGRDEPADVTPPAPLSDAAATPAVVATIAVPQAAPQESNDGPPYGYGVTIACLFGAFCLTLYMAAKPYLYSSRGFARYASRARLRAHGFKAARSGRSFAHRP